MVVWWQKKTNTEKHKDRESSFKTTSLVGKVWWYGGKKKETQRDRESSFRTTSLVGKVWWYGGKKKTNTEKVQLSHYYTNQSCRFTNRTLCLFLYHTTHLDINYKNCLQLLDFQSLNETTTATEKNHTELKR